MKTPEQILSEYWGYNDFRPLQKEIISSILDGTDTLALLPTGGGKSVCFQVPALIREGVCLVISPLIALMQDQVQRLKKLNIPAESIHSGLHHIDVRRILDNTINSGYKLLYVSPERLQTDLFRDYLEDMELSLIAIDEAHCISQWGHDFRPSYLKIADIRPMFPDVPVLALTATATPDVQQDIAVQLQLTKPAVFRQSFARTNIHYGIRYSENKNGDTLSALTKSSSIIYCRSRKQTEAVSRFLNQSGVAATAYHAGMMRPVREKAQELWMNNTAPAMVATTAFGMGIDKPDVRMVLHYDAPEHPEAYYQEAGRAGRDGKPSVALGLYNNTDIKRLQESITLQFPPEAYLRQVYQAVVEYLQVPIGNEPDQYFPFELVDFCQKFGLKPNEAIHALKLLEREGLWTLSEAVYSPATLLFTTDRSTLDDLSHTQPALAYLTIGLLRMYNTVFHFPTHVRETAIARQLKMDKEDVISELEQLHRMGVLEYKKPGDGPQLFFHHYRVDSRHLLINLKRIEVLRQRHIKRTEAMIAFLENQETCRERLLLTYFGETVLHDCGHCDNCAKKQSTPPDRQQLQKELLELIGISAPIRIDQVLAGYPAPLKDTVLALLRTLLDEHLITVADGYLQPAAQH